MHPLLERFGAATAAQLRPMRNRLPALLASGEVMRPYPGVYVDARRARETEVRLRAVQLSMPPAVFVGPAVRAFFDPGEQLNGIDVAVATPMAPRPGVRQHRIEVPEIFETRGLRLADPAWNALYTAAYDDGHGIDHFLRRRGTLAQLREAMTHFEGKHGTPTRRRLLAETRQDSWSGGERALHRLLRSADVPPWQANKRVATSFGTSHVVDVVFKEARVIVEFDGWEFHSSRLAFERDRDRQAELAADGWVVIRLTWRQLEERPDWVVSCLDGALRAGGQRRAA